MRRTLLSLIFLVAFSSIAYASPLVITGGTATINQPAGASIGSFNLLATDFSATGSGERNSANGLTNIHGSSNFIGSVTSNGNTQSGRFSDNTILNFILAPFTPPDPNSAANTVIVSTAFTMTGNLELVAAAPGQPVLFSTAIAGSGIAQITYTRLSPSAFIPTNVVYNFAAPQAIPEPATLTLLGAGIASLSLYARRRLFSAATR